MKDQKYSTKNSLQFYQRGVAISVGYVVGCCDEDQPPKMQQIAGAILPKKSPFPDINRGHYSSWALKYASSPSSENSLSLPLLLVSSSESETMNTLARLVDLVSWILSSSPLALVKYAPMLSVTKSEYGCNAMQVPLFRFSRSLSVSIVGSTFSFFFFGSWIALAAYKISKELQQSLSSKTIHCLMHYLGNYPFLV